MERCHKERIKIYSYTHYPKNVYEVKQIVEVFRHVDGAIEISTTTKHGDMVTACVCSLDKSRSQQLTESLVDTDVGGVLDMNIDRSEKYKHDPTKCPHYGEDGKCMLPRDYICKRINGFGYCNHHYQ